MKLFKKLQQKLFIWLGNKLYKHQGHFRDDDMILFSNQDQWRHKYNLSKWEMGIKTKKLNS
uniref:Uncharacterized protein n=1 Tax=viral metagenome TaxID=1070528 RepID=A0A6M3J225_9ZZZZ